MSSCRQLEPALSRMAEGEANPDEALLVARHLQDCTTCRILLAKERRLAEMLEHDLADVVAVGEEFLGRVMDKLPDGPPPRRKRRRKGLTVAVLAGIWLAGIGGSAAWTGGGGGSVGRSLLAGASAVGAESWTSRLDQGAGLIAGLVDAVGAGLGNSGPAASGLAGLLPVLGALLALVGLGVSGLVALAAVAHVLGAYDRS